ncbi:MAG: nucleotidyltransferase domain-containing protein [Thermoprotei archaeon]|nr:MAG: nucleotidyltransferase domain-containing protein [Thermoprotei archaeon]
MFEERVRYYRLSEERKRKALVKIGRILDDERVLLGMIFGSFVELSSFRDIDVAVYAGGKEDALDFLGRLCFRLEYEVGYPFDVVPLSMSLPPKFRVYILTKGVVVLEKVAGLVEALLFEALDELESLRFSS